MHGLKAVAHVGEGARGDNRHRILDERLFHLAAELRDLQGAAIDILTCGSTTIDGTEALLELAVVIGVLIVPIGFDVHIGIGILTLLSACKKALQIIGHGIARCLGRIVVVDIVCHSVTPSLCVQEARVMGVLLDVLAAIADFGTHKLAHRSICRYSIVDGHAL